MSEENRLDTKENVVFSTRFHFCSRKSLKTYYQVGTESDGDTQVNLVVDFDACCVHLGPGYKFHRLIASDAGLEGNTGSYSFVKTDKGPIFIYRSGRKLEDKERDVVIKLIKDTLELE